MKDVREAVRDLGGMRAVHDALNRIAQDVRCVVAGECIQDVYRYVVPEGISSKSPTLSCRWRREERSYGGTWAIVAHAEQFCRTEHLRGHAMHKKIRYISETTGQRLFEVCDIADEAAITYPETFREVYDRANLALIADFGHGYFEQNPCPAPADRGGPVFQAANVQTNSSNFGFNPFHKRRADYLVLDLRELRLGFNDRDTDAVTLGARLHGEWGVPIGLTLGPQGSVMFDRERVYASPAFTPNGVRDATGAGDAYFALTALLLKVGADPLLTAFLGNVFAGLKTQITGNSRAVLKSELLSACAEILGELPLMEAANE